MLQNLAHRQEHTFLAGHRHAKKSQQQVRFQAGRLKPLVARVHLRDFLLVEPVAEPLLPQHQSLSVHPRIVHGMRVGVVNVHHREGQPAPASRGVIQKLRLVGRATETRDVRTVLLVMSVCPPLVHRRQGHHRLELVDVAQAQLVNLLQANQRKFRQRQVIVLRQPSAVGAHAEIPLQFRRQQPCQPGRLVAALPPHQHQNLVVRHLLHHQRHHHSHQPLAETIIKQFRVTLHVHRGRQPPDVVGHPVPRRQRAEILRKRVELRHKLRLQHRTHIAQAYRVPLLGHSAPQRVHQAVGQLHKLPGLGMPHLLLPGNHVLPELRLRGEKLLNLLGRGQLGTSFPLLLPLRTKQFRLPPSVRLRIGITRAENGRHVAVVFRKASVRPADGLLQRQPELVHQIPHAHDVLVVMMRGIHHALLLQLPADTGHHTLHPSPARLIRLLHARKVEAERFRPVVVMHPRVMRQSAQSRGILAGRVESTLRQLLVILVHPVEHLGVQCQTVIIGHLPVQAVTAHHPHPLPADGGISQHSMRVGTHFFEHLLRLSFGQMVKVHHRETRPATDVGLPFPVLKTHRHGKAGAGRLFPVGGRLLPLRAIVTVLFGVVGQHLVLPNQTDHFIKTHRHGHRVGITLKNT